MTGTQVKELGMGYVAYMDIGSSDADKPTCMGSVTTTTGWGDLCRWIDTLKPVPNFEGLHHVRAYGWNQDLAEMEQQLVLAIESQPPHDKGVLETAETLLQILRKRKDASWVAISETE